MCACVYVRVLGMYQLVYNYGIHTTLTRICTSHLTGLKNTVKGEFKLALGQKNIITTKNSNSLTHSRIPLSAPLFQDKLNQTPPRTRTASKQEMMCNCNRLDLQSLEYERLLEICTSPHLYKGGAELLFRILGRPELLTYTTLRQGQNLSLIIQGRLRKNDLSRFTYDSYMVYHSPPSHIDFERF